MADQKQVLDVKVSKGITTAQSNEHLRDRSERAEKYAMNKGNYDPTRKHLNFEIAPGGKVRPIDTSRNGGHIGEAWNQRPQRRTGRTEVPHGGELHFRRFP